MKLKTTLTGGVAVAILMAAGAAHADATPAKHHKTSKVAKPTKTEQELKSEVDTLQAEVKALEARLDAQAQAQQQSAAQAQAQIQSAQAQAQAAQSAAQTAQTQAAAAETVIKTIPGQVETAAKANAPKPGWWNNTTLGGTVFADLSYISNKNDGVKNAQSGTDYDIKRMYIQVDHKFNSIFAANLTTDFTYDSTTKATQLYIKKAYLEAKLDDAFTIRAGSADMPWVPFVEKIYGYRYAERVLIDLNGYGTSADWGVHAFGSLFDNHVGYALSVVDGEGYKIPATGTANRTDAMDVEGRVNATYDHITVAVGGYDGKLGHDVTNTVTFNTAERFDALLAYTDSRIRVGGEYLWAHYYNDVTQANPAKTNESDGYSVFGSFNLTPKLSVLGRYDWIKPDTNTQPDFVGHYYNVGVSYTPVKGVDLALMFKHDSIDDGLLSTQNGSIGTTHANLIGNGTYNEIGVFTGVKF